MKIQKIRSIFGGFALRPQYINLNTCQLAFWNPTSTPCMESGNMSTNFKNFWYISQIKKMEGNNWLQIIQEQ